MSQENKGFSTPRLQLGPRHRTKVERADCRLSIGVSEPRGDTPMPVIAHTICQSCGARDEAATPSHRVSVTLCPCGGMRQVVRVVRQPYVEASVSAGELERNVQVRASDETLTP
jgi:hypothetical protein